MTRSRALARARDACAFAVCLLSMLALLERVLPLPRHALLEEKLEELARSGRSYDTFFLGSSVVYRSYDPEAFDAATAAAGLPTRSFNLGVEGFHVVDLVHLADELAKLDLGEGARALLHSCQHVGDIDLEIPLSYKSIAWHDPLSTLVALELLWQGELPLGRKLLLGWRHLQALGYRELRLGRALPPLQRLLGLRRDGGGNPGRLGADGRGFVPPEDEPNPAMGRQREAFLQELDAYRQSLARHRPPPRDGSRLGFFARANLRRMDARLRALGFELCYVTGIHLVKEPGLADALHAGILGPTLFYDDPRLYPELFLPRLHYDRPHLGREGARIFSELLGRDYAALLRGQGEAERSGVR